MLRFCFQSICVEFSLAISKEKSKNVSANQRPGRPSWFSNRPKNLIEDVKTLLPIKFRQILFSGYRGKVEYVSAKQRPGAHLGFLSARKTHKLGRGRCVLALCQGSSNSVQWFQRRSRKCVSQSETGAVILVSWSALQTQLGKGSWDPVSFHFSPTSVHRFQRSLQLRCTKTHTLLNFINFQKTFQGETLHFNFISRRK